MSAGPERLPRLLVLASTYPRWAGDPEPGFVHELARRLTDRFEVIVVCPHAPGARTAEMLDGVRVLRYRYAPAAWETLVSEGGIVANLKRQRWKALLLPGFALAQAWATWRAVRRHAPDVIHAHWLVPQGLVIALLASLPGRWPPFVVTSHGADLFALRGAPWLTLKRFVVRRAAAVTVVSSAMLEPVRQLGTDQGKLSVQSMGVDLQQRFRPDPTVPREPQLLLFVGRLVAKKGVRHLLDAMPRLLAAKPGLRLEIVGFGPEEAALRQRVAELGLAGYVDFVGAVPQSELPDRYRRASVFVAPFVVAKGGDQEGLGLVLVEAAGCGCPVVAGDVPAVRDVVGDPRIGIVLDPTDPARLADAILAELEGEASMPARAAARAGAVMRFDWSRREAAYACLLEGVCEPRS